MEVTIIYTPCSYQKLPATKMREEVGKMGNERKQPIIV